MAHVLYAGCYIGCYIGCSEQVDYLKYRIYLIYLIWAYTVFVDMQLGV